MAERRAGKMLRVSCCESLLAQVRCSYIYIHRGDALPVAVALVAEKITVHMRRQSWSWNRKKVPISEPYWECTRSILRREVSKVRWMRAPRYDHDLYFRNCRLYIRSIPGIIYRIGIGGFSDSTRSDKYRVVYRMNRFASPYRTGIGFSCDSQHCKTINSAALVGTSRIAIF